jgi:hypothetical protein
MSPDLKNRTKTGKRTQNKNLQNKTHKIELFGNKIK